MDDLVHLSLCRVKDTEEILKEAKKRGILQTLEEWANGFEEAQLLSELAS